MELQCNGTIKGIYVEDVSVALYPPDQNSYPPKKQKTPLISRGALEDMFPQVNSVVT